MNTKTFHIDYIEATLRELNKTRNTLTNQMKASQNKRQKLEKILESLHKKHSQLKESHQKLSQTVNVGYHKVSQTQSQAESLENMIQEQRDKIKNIMKEFEGQKSLQQKNVNYVGEQLAEIGRKMKEAKSFYTEDNILKETEIVDTKKIKMAEQIIAIEADIEAGKNNEEMCQKSPQPNITEHFTESFKDEVLKIFKRENGEYNKCYEKLKVEYDGLAS